MVLFLGYIEERWGYLVITEIQDKSSHEIIQEPIILLHDTFWQFCPLRPACTQVNGVRWLCSWDCCYDF